MGGRGGGGGVFFFFQAEDGIRDAQESRGLGDVYKRQGTEVLELISRLNQDGKTIVLVTHDDKVAERAQRVVRMKDGRIDRDEQRAPNATAAPAR